MKNVNKFHLSLS